MVSIWRSLYWGIWNSLVTLGGNLGHVGYISSVFQVTASINCQVRERIPAFTFVSSSYSPDMRAESSHHCYLLTKFLTHRNYKLTHYCFRPLSFQDICYRTKTANRVVVAPLIVMG